MIYTKEVIKKIGFKELPNPDQSDFLDSFEYDFESFKLKVRVLMNRHFNMVYLFSGILNTGRTARTINFELPLVVESFEQGIALISYSLGTRFYPEIVPAWYKDGLNWTSHLPWNKDRDEYNNLPKTFIEHDSFKLIARKLYAIALKSKEEDITTFSFDGEILKINCSGNMIISQAVGKPWTDIAKVKSMSLIHIPKRIKKAGIVIYIWKFNLHIDNVLFSLLNINN